MSADIFSLDVPRERRDIKQSLGLEDVPTWIVLLAFLATLLYSVPPLFVLGMACAGPNEPCQENPLLALLVFAGTFVAWPWMIFL